MPEDWNRVVGLLDYPMFIVTTRAGDEVAGCLVGFATQTSIDPPRFLVGLSKRNRTFRVAERADRVVVHLLGRDDRSLAELFGGETGDETDKFARCDWSPGPEGVPLLDAAAAWFSGKVLTRESLGDHLGVLIAPDAAGVRDDVDQLLRFSDVRDLEPGHPA